tara:strand:+ start:594 stop:1493 length:900 start_codon:yes stop_codon:yes gene_type:complete
MDRFLALTVFTEVAAHGGFAAAARSLSLSPPAVTRAVSALEERMGTRLFVRTTRSVRLTESGERFLADAKRILADLEEAEEAAVGSHAEPRGELRVTAPDQFGCHFITPIIGEFLDAHPQVSAETLFVDRVVNIVNEGLDVAVRIGDLPDSSLTAIRVGNVRRVLCAAPDYLSAHGRPDHPEALRRHRIIQALAVTSSDQWSFQEGGRPTAVRVAPRVRLNTNDAAITLTRLGWGITRVLSYQAAAHIADGSLVRLLEDFETAPLPVHVVHHEGRMVSAKVRAFVDFAVDRLRRNPVLT